MKYSGKKVLLRDKTLSDAAKDYEWRTDEELSRLDAAMPLTLSFEEFLSIYEEELRYPSPRRVRFAVETPEGKQIGNCMYYDVDLVRREAELGIMIGDRAYWNGGYGTDAVETLLAYIFQQTSLTRVYLHTLDWNVRAQKSFAKAGFVSIGRVRKEGYTFVKMEILKDLWEKARKDAQKPE